MVRQAAGSPSLSLCSRALWTPGEVRASQSLSPHLLKDADDSGAYFAGVPMRRQLENVWEGWGTCLLPHFLWWHPRSHLLHGRQALELGAAEVLLLQGRRLQHEVLLLGCIPALRGAFGRASGRELLCGLGVGLLFSIALRSSDLSIETVPISTG